MSTGGSSSGAASNSKSHHSATSTPLPPSFHLLEVTLLSAQDLYPASCWMKAYAVAWAHPDRKLRTRTDPSGGTDPTWNDKFVFCVDPAFLHSDTSSVTVDIFASAPLARDALVGTARVVISSLGCGPRFVALQVRRPRSLRPQGIINVGVALVDEYIHRVPMMRDSVDGSAAFALKDLANSPTVVSRGTTRSSNSYGGSGDLEERRRRVDRMKSENNVVGNEMRMQREAEELESKLEKWRIELSPEQDKERNTGRTRRLSRSLSCFGCG